MRKTAKTLSAVSNESSDKPLSDVFIYGAPKDITHWSHNVTFISTGQG